MIYIASDLQKNLVPSLDFSNRGLTGLTQGRVSDIVLFGKPTAVQLAFSGYKDAIEAFLYATAVGKKTLVSAGHFPIPTDYAPTVPLPLPQTIFRLAKAANPEQLKKLKEALESAGIKEVSVGKGLPSFTVTTPSFKHLSSSLPTICSPTAATVEGHAQLGGSTASLRIYQCIDLFLRVNTYSYKRGTSDHATTSVNTSVDTLHEARVEAMYYRGGYDNKSKVAKTLADVAERKRVDDQEEEDLSPHRSTTVSLLQSVYVAKPSPKPSTTSWGAPSEVPNRGGILFPYFQGMLSADAAGLRELVTQLFFRNLGSSTVDARTALKDLRGLLGTVASTKQGVLITHVLKGIALALETQTQLYLLFESEVYLGFTLLGEEFSIFAHGKWVDPLDASSLKDELSNIQTHRKTLEDLLRRLHLCTSSDGDMLNFVDTDITTVSDLADLLAKVKVTEEGQEEEDISKILARLSFKSDYLTFKPKNLAATIDLLTSPDPFPRDQNFFIPLKKWSGIASKEYKAFASYGPRGPSFRNSRGTEMNIPRGTEPDPFMRRDDKGQLYYDKLIVGEKVISECLLDWENLRKKRSVKMDFVERAAGSRSHVFKERNMETIWDALKRASQSGQFSEGGGAEPSEKEKKRSFQVAFGSGSIDSVF